MPHRSSISQATTTREHPLLSGLSPPPPPRRLASQLPPQDQASSDQRRRLQQTTAPASAKLQQLPARTSLPSARLRLSSTSAAAAAICVPGTTRCPEQTSLSSCAPANRPRDHDCSNPHPLSRTGGTVPMVTRPSIQIIPRGPALVRGAPNPRRVTCTLTMSPGMHQSLPADSAWPATSPVRAPSLWRRRAPRLRLPVLQLHRTEESVAHRHQILWPARPASRVHQRRPEHDGLPRRALWI